MSDPIRAILQGLRVTVTVRADDAKRAVKAVMDRASNLEPMLGRVAEIMRLDAKLQFQVGGIPSWTPLKPATIAEKARQGYPRLDRKGRPGAQATQSLTPYGQDGVSFGPAAILIRTQALLSSWTDKDDPDHVEEIDGNIVRIGSSIPYAGAHQTGSDRLPKRPLVVTDDAKRQTERETMVYIETGEIKRQ